MRHRYLLILALFFAAANAFKFQWKSGQNLRLNLQNYTKTLFVPPMARFADRRRSGLNGTVGLMVNTPVPTIFDFSRSFSDIDTLLNHSWLYLCRKRFMWFSDCIDSAVDPRDMSVYFSAQSQLKDGDYYFKIKALDGGYPPKYQTMGKSPVFKLLRTGQLSSRAPVQISSLELVEKESYFDANDKPVFLRTKFTMNYLHSRDIEIVLLNSQSHKRLTSIKYSVRGGMFEIPLDHLDKNNTDQHYIEIYGYTGWFSRMLGKRTLFYRHSFVNQRCDEDLPGYLKSTTSLLCISFGNRSSSPKSQYRNPEPQNIQEPLYIHGEEVFTVEHRQSVTIVWELAYDYRLNYTINDGKIDPSLRYLYEKEHLDDNMVQIALKYAIARLNDTRVASQIHVIDPALYSINIDPEGGYPVDKRYHILPYADNTHIILLVYDSELGKFLVVDSYSRNRQIAHQQSMYENKIKQFHNFISHHFNDIITTFNWHRDVVVMKCPFSQQTDGYNCGIYSIINGLKLFSDGLEWMERAFEGECVLSRIPQKDADRFRRDIFVTLGTVCQLNDPQLLFPSCVLPNEI